MHKLRVALAASPFLAMQLPVLSLVSDAGALVQVILVILAGFSLLSWHTFVSKLIALRGVSRHHRRVMEQQRAHEEEDGLAWNEGPDSSGHGPAGLLVAIAASEHDRILADLEAHPVVAADAASLSFFMENQFHLADEHMDSAIVTQSKQLEKGLVLLAIVSTVSPLLGLLGTVWGITNSFFQIGQQKSASLAVVAPGIAEALVTTIAGLAVAIPAVAFYNYLTHRILGAQDAMEDVKEAMSRLLRLSVMKKRLRAGRGVM